MSGCDFVFHLAANADVRFGLDDPRKDLEQNTIATWNVLEAMRTHGVKPDCVFLHGLHLRRAGGIPDAGRGSLSDPNLPLRGFQAGWRRFDYSVCGGLRNAAGIFRFVSILGDRYTHGRVFDFYKQLKAHPDRLEILGNGRQLKSYLHVHDCISAMLTALEKARERLDIFNLGTAEFCAVNESIAWISECLGLQPQLCYSGVERDGSATVRSSFWNAREFEASVGLLALASAKASFKPFAFCRTTNGFSPDVPLDKGRRTRYASPRPPLLPSASSPTIALFRST